ncbi:hypothetical protein M407DRAFT_28079 [Tulasnella calospora MUT 4182]|uniref:Uncharacterized protein n=1 Tax=Tulasnella calospora MUT 4182 TaxID=1051891 RepID=A0A0C3Q205_9AGAM|nr:hypothetical protein M407DRAFT_28079 [Tulasnella calospora MUT 4182]
MKYDIERHMRQMHDPWTNLEQDCRIKDPDIFECPKCQASFPSVPSVIAHGLRDCPHREWFHEMRLKHAVGLGSATIETADEVAEGLFHQHEKGRAKVWKWLKPEDQDSWKEMVRQSLQEGLTFESVPVPEGLDLSHKDDFGMVGGSKTIEALQALFKTSPIADKLKDFGLIIEEGEARGGNPPTSNSE